MEQDSIKLHADDISIVNSFSGTQSYDVDKQESGKNLSCVEGDGEILFIQSVTTHKFGRLAA